LGCGHRIPFAYTGGGTAPERRGDSVYHQSSPTNECGCK
jgi:hypothetical protein